MKKYITLVFILILGLSAFGQEKALEKDQSNLEKFSAKSGSLIEKVFLDVGSVKTAKVQILTLTDLISGAKISGVRFEYDTGERYASSKIAFLDKDELDGLLKSIALIKTKVFASNPTTYTEVAFTSRSGFAVGCYFDSGKWTSFMKVSKYDSKSSILMASADLDTLETALIQAKEKL